MTLDNPLAGRLSHTVLHQENDSILAARLNSATIERSVSVSLSVCWVTRQRPAGQHRAAGRRYWSFSCTPTGCLLLTAVTVCVVPIVSSRFTVLLFVFLRVCRPSVVCPPDKHNDITRHSRDAISL